MGSYYADVIVDITHEKLDRTFQYRIPQRLLHQVCVGSQVEIPFGSGNRQIRGYEKTKEILSVDSGVLTVESRLISLAGWMKKTYGCTMIQALKTVIPIRKKTKEKEERFILLELPEEEALERLLKDDYTTESRIMLKETAKFKGEDSRTSCYALNDMVIAKQGECRLITVKVFQGEELVDIYRADGLIVATPTGSTGYNLSAGGPVLVPGLHATVITPICAHSLNKRSLLLDAKERIVLEIGQTKEAGEDTAVLQADGRTVGMLKTGDRLVLEVPHATTDFIKLSGLNFYEKMRQKLNGN